jgi:hypothetical protein
MAAGARADGGRDARRRPAPSIKECGAVNQAGKQSRRTRYLIYESASVKGFPHVAPPEGNVVDTIKKNKLRCARWFLGAESDLNPRRVISPLPVADSMKSFSTT